MPARTQLAGVICQGASLAYTMALPTQLDKFIFQLHVQKYIPAGELIRLTYISQEPWMHTLYMHTIVLTLE